MVSDVACAVHGAAPRKLVCREIADAIRARVPLPARADTALESDIGVRTELTLCAACLVEYDIPLEPTPIAPEEAADVETIVGLQESICRKCFKIAERELGTRRA